MIDRRIRIDDEDYMIYRKLLDSNSIFKGLNIMDLFTISLALGKKAQHRTKLGSGALGRIRESTFLNSDVKYFMMALAVSEDDSLDVLTNDDEYIKICEEYAKTGICLLYQRYSDYKYELLDEMEMEILDVHDDYIKED